MFVIVDDQWRLKDAKNILAKTCPDYDLWQFKKRIIIFCIFAKDLCISLQDYVFKFHWCVELANFKVIK